MLLTRHYLQLNLSPLLGVCSIYWEALLVQSSWKDQLAAVEQEQSLEEVELAVADVDDDDDDDDVPVAAAAAAVVVVVGVVELEPALVPAAHVVDVCAVADDDGDDVDALVAGEVLWFVFG